MYPSWKARFWHIRNIRLKGIRNAYKVRDWNAVIDHIRCIMLILVGK